jgi:hypothetical protein
MHASGLATGGSPMKNITAIDTDYPDVITTGCVWLDRGHRRSVQRLIDYAVSALRRGGVLSALCDSICNVPAGAGKCVLPLYGFTMFTMFCHVYHVCKMLVRILLAITCIPRSTVIQLSCGLNSKPYGNWYDKRWTRLYNIHTGTATPSLLPLPLVLPGTRTPRTPRPAPLATALGGQRRPLRALDRAQPAGTVGRQRERGCTLVPAVGGIEVGRQVAGLPTAPAALSTIQLIPFYHHSIYSLSPFSLQQSIILAVYQCFRRQPTARTKCAAAQRCISCGGAAALSMLSCRNPHGWAAELS